jgi:hypothetical protein
VTASRDATTLLEEGLRVLAAQLSQDDPERGRRVVQGLMLNAEQAAYEKAWLAKYAPDATPDEQVALLRYYGGES